jgi:CubicO group peptidase (beta-lactamase class C family)
MWAAKSTMLLFVVMALLVSTPVRAQDPAEAVDAIFGWATPATPGCAVAVSRHGTLVVNRAYGLADLERTVPLSPDTVFDVGSVSKQFVAAAVLLLVEDGQVALTDDVRAHIPELPDTGSTVTVDHLLTHTGGVRDWTGILPLAATSTDALTITLRQRGLNFAPGAEWSYSNSGYVLLKEIVARRSGMSFGEFTRTRLFEPLGMTRTTYQHDLREVVRDRALAYEQEDGRWKLDVLLGNDRGGGGGLLSTTGNLLIWNDALTSGRLGSFVTEMIQEPARLNNGRTLGYARGLFLDRNRGGRVVWHGGSAAAYNSLLARFPEQGLSIAILCNAGDIAETTVFARRIFDLFTPVAGAEGAVGSSAEPGVPGPDLNSKAGLFFSERTGEPLRLVVERAALRVAGGPRLVPITDDRFRPTSATLTFMSQDEFELRFVSQDQIELRSMEGRTTTYRRAEPYAPTPADLAAVAGRYESDEIGSVLEVAAGDGGLRVRLAHAPARTLTFEPVAPDTFQAGMVTVRLRRDEAGTVVALGYSSPVLRDVEFARQSEHGRRH